MKKLSIVLAVVVFVFGYSYIINEGDRKIIAYMNQNTRTFLTFVSHQEETNNKLADNIDKLNDNVEFVSKQLEESRGSIRLLRNQLEVNKEETYRPTYEDLKEYVVECYGDALNINWDTFELETESWIGTGFVIAKTERYTYIMTNRHVAGEGTSNVQIYVKTDNLEKKVKVDTIGICQDRDLAILRYEGDLKGKTPIKGFAEITYQERVFVVGHHLGRPYIYGEGIMAGYNYEEKIGDNAFILMQLPTLFGNSGSAVFNAKEEVVAIAFATYIYNGMGGADVAHAITVKASDAKRFMEIIMESEK